MESTVVVRMILIPCKSFVSSGKFFTLLAKLSYVIYSSTVELHLSGLIWTANHSDMQKIRIIEFFFEKWLCWQYEVKKIYKELF